MAQKISKTKKWFKERFSFERIIRAFFFAVAVGLGATLGPLFLKVHFAIALLIVMLIMLLFAGKFLDVSYPFKSATIQKTTDKIDSSEIKSKDEIKTKNVSLLMKIWRKIQKILPFLRTKEFYEYYKEYYNKKIVKDFDDLNFKIMLKANWLDVVSHHGKEAKKLSFSEKAIKYYEYRNMVIQRRAQYVIIFLTIVLLIMTGIQVYLQFNK